MSMVTLVRSQQEAANITSFWFRTERPLDYVAGQFIQLSVPHEHPDDRGIDRWFTLSSSPTEELISITTKFAARNGSTFMNALRILKPGKRLQMADPMGDFVLPKDTGIPLVFIAGGIGITPFRSMITWLIATGEQRNIQLIYAVETAQELIFTDVFAHYAIDPIIFINRPSAKWYGDTGALSADRILRSIDVPELKRIYISGPEQMVEVLFKDLQTQGIAREQLVADYFHGYAVT